MDEGKNDKVLSVKLAGSEKAAERGNEKIQFSSQWHLSPLERMLTLGIAWVNDASGATTTIRPDNIQQQYASLRQALLTPVILTELENVSDEDIKQLNEARARAYEGEGPLKPGPFAAISINEGSPLRGKRIKFLPSDVVRDAKGVRIDSLRFSFVDENDLVIMPAVIDLESLRISSGMEEIMDFTRTDDGGLQITEGVLELKLKDITPDSKIQYKVDNAQ